MTTPPDHSIAIIRMPAAAARDSLAVVSQTPPDYIDYDTVIGLWDDGAAVVGSADLPSGSKIRVTVSPCRTPDPVGTRPMTDGEIHYYADGLREATQMFLDLALGENASGILPPEQFSRLMYTGPIPPEMKEWLRESRERAKDQDLQGDIEQAGRDKRDGRKS